jgi:palmitoyl-protein thioesterase
MNKVMLIMFGSDEILYPRETSFFQEHDLRSGNIIAYNETELYKTDAIGLKSMQEQGKIERYILDGGSHI